MVDRIPKWLKSLYWDVYGYAMGLVVLTSGLYLYSRVVDILKRNDLVEWIITIVTIAYTVVIIHMFIKFVYVDRHKRYKKQDG